MVGVSVLERDHYVNNWLDRIADLEARLQDLERSAKTGAATVVQVDVSNVTTPTDAELDAAFGTPAEVGAGFTALVNDAGASTAVFLVCSDGVAWWYEALTKAT